MARQEQLPLFEPPSVTAPVAPGPAEEALARLDVPAAGDDPPADSLDAELAAITDLAALEAAARDCRRCGLRAGCRGVVFGEGNPRARLMLVGEGPGATEDELGRPFVGKAGELLDRILAAAGFAREEVYINNVVMCRPPGNRVPAEAEMAACLPWLRARIRIIRPGVIVCLGATAARALIHPQARITQLRGRWHERGGIFVMPTYHPAALLRDPSKKRPVWEDFQQVRDLVRRLATERAQAASEGR